MRKKLIALITAVSAVFALAPYSMTISADTGNSQTARIMENLDRGTVAVKTSGGVYLSWRLLGTEALANQAFDIYRNGEKIYTTGVHDATCYTDAQGTDSSKYIVVPSGESIDGEKSVTPWTTNTAYSNGGFSNSVAYKDIIFTAPSDGTTPEGDNYTYSANDMSTGDLDGDGEYEIIVKWDPSNSQDNSITGYTGEVYMDAYKLDGTRLWRMNLGKNIRAGAHYTQYIVYDFDCDGKSEIAFKTAPGSRDGQNNYVSKAGKSSDITDADDTADYRNSAGTVLDGPEWLTIFDGETGAAMHTVNYDPPRSIHSVSDKNSPWGDNYGNRCERYLAGVAYLDGVHPSLIMTRGYYTYVYAAAYTWDGENLTEQWLSKNEPVGNGSTSGCTVIYADGTSKQDKNKTLYAQGAHSLSVADVDNDGFDEIIFGSAVLDHDGTVLLYDGRGHGDAEHVSDFDNDGQQEIFMVHEAGKSSDETIPFAVDIKRYNGDIMLQPAVGDIGRGVMANIDDEYALSSGNLAAFWSTASGTDLFNQQGERIGNIPNSNNKLFENFFIYWDGDLGRELLDGVYMAKQNIANNVTTRIYYDRNHNYFPDVYSNNGTKATPGLVADILGDWREEVVYPLSDGTGARIYFSTIPTTYRLTTLMHDSQYRCAVAWQNVGYNQPPHQSYYIGSAALAKNSNGDTLNYLAPATAFDEVTYPDAPERTPRPSADPQQTTAPNEENKITATKVRNEIGSQQAEPSEGTVWLNYYQNMWGMAYFGFEGIQNFDPDKIIKAEIQFTASGYGTTVNREFSFDLLKSDNNWTAGTFTSTDRNPAINKANLISQTTCHTSGNGDVLKVGQAVSFDITDYVKSFAKGTEEISIIAAVSSGASVLTLHNNPVLMLTVEAPTPTPTAEPTPSPTPTPTSTPTPSQTLTPTTEPTIEPTIEPTNMPKETVIPTEKPNAGYIADYDFENKYATIHCDIDRSDVLVIFASYDENGKLINIRTVTMDLQKDKDIKPTVQDFENGDKVKIFVWKSFDNPEPIMTAKEF